MALKNPRLKFTVTEPGNPPFERKCEVSGYVSDRDKLIPLLVHPWADGAKISRLRAVDANGKDLAEQPEELREMPVIVEKPADNTPAAQ